MTLKKSENSDQTKYKYTNKVLLNKYTNKVLLNRFTTILRVCGLSVFLEHSTKKNEFQCTL